MNTGHFLRLRKEPHGVFTAYYGACVSVRVDPISACQDVVRKMRQSLEAQKKQRENADYELAVRMTGSYAGAADLVGASATSVRERVRGKTPMVVAKHLDPKRIAPGSATRARAALDNHLGFREHAHRALMESAEPDAHTSYGETFWPTCREPLQKQPALSIITRCQRCGVMIATSAGWWCEHCANVARSIQERAAGSMVFIAAMGEYDPPAFSETWTISPWLSPTRMALDNARVEFRRTDRVEKPKAAGNAASSLELKRRSAVQRQARKQYAENEYKSRERNYNRARVLRGGLDGSGVVA